MNDLLKEAEELSEEITEWYHEALLDMDSELNVENELFDITNALYVEGIEYNAIVEALCKVIIFRDNQFLLM